MESRQEFLDYIRQFNEGYDLELIGHAYDVAARQHEGQVRKSGEPYLIHPVATAKILAELGMDDSALVAGLLHDVVEDTDYTMEDLVSEFGEEIGVMVDGVTKLGNIVFDNKEKRQVENLRKMFLAMSRDIRVLIIKLADRLHNIRTMQYMKPQKIHDKCQETLEIYAPLAARLGMYGIKSEFEDTAMMYLYPEDYKMIEESLNDRNARRQELIDHITSELKDTLDDMGIRYTVAGRSKHIYSIFKKMKYQHKNLDEIFDLNAVRIIVESIRDCYAVLGIVHTMWTPIPGRFKDYVAMPKPNMYQSLHTTVIGDEGIPFEIQIRTYEMHRIAEYGIAAHWKYKEGISKDKEEVKLAWLRQALEWQKETNDPREFMESLRVDLFSSQVFVFTPAGDVIELPAGSTPLDFAFKIHTDVGAKCIGAKINGRMVPIDHVLKNGDIIEIMTSPNASGPSIDWLKIVKSSTARTKIRQWLKKETKSDDIERGRQLLDKYLRRKGYEPKDILKNAYLQRIIKEMNFNNYDEMYNQIANGGSLVGKAGSRLISYYEEENAEEKKKEENTMEAIKVSETPKKIPKHKDSSGIIVKGMDNLMIRVAKCCNPVPGDAIIGFITKGRGISVHRADCANMKALPEEEKLRFIDVEWDSSQAAEYDAEVTIVCDDRKGLFSDISKVCESNDIRIAGVHTTNLKNDGTITVVLTLAIVNVTQMEKLLLAFKNIPNVKQVFRSKA